MDPNAALAAIREALTGARQADDWDTYGNALAQVPELFENLDEWLSRGGFLPEEWQHGNTHGTRSYLNSNPTPGGYDDATGEPYYEGPFPADTNTQAERGLGSNY